jgi:hypothetical protein
VCTFSYDSVVAMTDVGGMVPESNPALPKQCLVSSRWLTDTDNFNEWMNEEDYQLIIVVRLPMPGAKFLLCCGTGWEAPPDSSLPWSHPEEILQGSSSAFRRGKFCVSTETTSYVSLPCRSSFLIPVS